MGSIPAQFMYKNQPMAPTGVAQLVGYHSENKKVNGSIPSQGTCLSCRFGPQLRHVQKAASQLMFLSPIDVSLPLPLPPFPSKIKFKKIKKNPRMNAYINGTSRCLSLSLSKNQSIKIFLNKKFKN